MENLIAVVIVVIFGVIIEAIFRSALQTKKTCELHSWGYSGQKMVCKNCDMTAED